MLENFGSTGSSLALFKIQAFWEFLRGLRRWGKLERIGFEKGVEGPRMSGSTIRR